MYVCIIFPISILLFTFLFIAVRCVSCGGDGGMVAYVREKEREEVRTERRKRESSSYDCCCRVWLSHDAAAAGRS